MKWNAGSMSKGMNVTEPSPADLEEVIRGCRAAISDWEAGAIEEAASQVDEISGLLQSVADFLYAKAKRVQRDD